MSNLYYGMKVLVKVNPNGQYSLHGHRSKAQLGELKNFDLTDCHFRYPYILGILTDLRPNRLRIIVEGDKLGGKLPINFCDHLTFMENGVWN